MRDRDKVAGGGEEGNCSSNNLLDQGNSGEIMLIL